MGVQVEPGQQGVVVEHLLEVGDEPIGIGGVAGETASYLIVDAAPGHLLQGEVDHLQGPVVVAVAVIPKQHLQVHCLGELGCGTGASILVVKVGRQHVISPVEYVHRQRRVGLGHLACSAHLFGQLGGNSVDLAPVVVVRVGHRLKQPGESRHVEAVHRREIGASVERAPIRGEEHGHRPTTAAGQHLNRFHIDGV